MKEVLPFFLGSVALPLGSRGRRLGGAAACLVLGAVGSAIAGELATPLAPVFVLIDATLAWLGMTLAAALSVYLRQTVFERRRDVER